MLVSLTAVLSRLYQKMWGVSCEAKTPLIISDFIVIKLITPASYHSLNKDGGTRRASDSSPKLWEICRWLSRSRMPGKQASSMPNTSVSNWHRNEVMNHAGMVFTATGFESWIFRLDYSCCEWSQRLLYHIVSLLLV